MPAPHVFILGAVALGGIAAVGYIIFKEMQEQQYEYYRQHQRQRQQDLFRFANDFDFENTQEQEEEDEKVQQESQLRNRRPHSNKENEERRKSLEQDQYELFELENSINERKRRLLAEQAFLDREEELLRSRQNELMRNEQLLNEVNTVSEYYNPFSDRYGQDVSSFFDAQENSEHSDNTAILIENEEQHSTTNTTSTAPSDTTSTAPSEIGMSSSDLQLPSVSHIQHEEVSSQATVTDSEPTSHANSDSEESWDAVSDNDWNRSISDHSERRHSIHSISDSLASFTDDEARF